MARPRKEGFDYFSFDVGFFWDKKIKGLKGRFGISGVAVYIYLLAQVYGDKGYYTKADVEKFRAAVVKYLVPLADSIYREQARRLGKQYPMNMADNTAQVGQCHYRRWNTEAISSNVPRKRKAKHD